MLAGPSFKDIAISTVLLRAVLASIVMTPLGTLSAADAQPPAPATQAAAAIPQISAAATDAAGHAPAGAKPKPAPKPAPKGGGQTGWYVESRGYGTRRDTQPPRYVRQADKTGIKAFEGLDWIDLGLDYRVRYEYRDNDYRRSVQTLDAPFLLRTRFYLGIKHKLDPLRLVLEVEDARWSGSQFPDNDRDVNTAEPIQAFGELYFADAIGKSRPLSLKFGRQAFEYLDRRLLARNEWRNTTNTFDGLRATFGRQENDWQLDLLALRPVDRLLYELDRTNASRWLSGVVGDWRRWSKVVTLQPYYLHFTQDAALSPARAARDVHTMGLRAYGIVGASGWDWDVDLAQQFGKDGSKQHRAQGLVVEAGYSPLHPWKPRLSANYSYASGDRNSADGVNQRFERLFGFSRPFSANDYVQWENMSAPKLRIEFDPASQVRVDAGYSWYWLASATDRWGVTGLHDPSGASGTFMGQEFDVRVRFPVGARVGVNVGYAWFRPGAFTRATSGRSDASEFLYVELMLNAFR